MIRESSGLQDCCTEEELSKHREACHRYNQMEVAGLPLEGEPCPSGMIAPGIHVTSGGGFGIGMYEVDLAEIYSRLADERPHEGSTEA